MGYEYFFIIIVATIISVAIALAVFGSMNFEETTKGSITSITLKDWRDNASCEQLNEYLIENIEKFDYRDYRTVEKLWEIKCK